MNREDLAKELDDLAAALRNADGETEVSGNGGTNVTERAQTSKELREMGQKWLDLSNGLLKQSRSAKQRAEQYLAAARELDRVRAMEELLKLEEDTSPLPKVLAFFSVSELLKMKKVSRKWRDMCTRAINNKCPDPPKPFQSNEELCDAITKWCTYDPEAMEELACTYGYPINKWDVSRVTDFSFIFQGKHTFNEYIGDWDVSNATNMEGMFWYAGAFNQPLTNWNTSKVTNMEGMFCHALAFNQYIGDWDVSNATTMEDMFLCARAFNQSLASWNCSNVTRKHGMFLYASSFSHFATLPVELQNWEEED